MKLSITVFVAAMALPAAAQDDEACNSEAQQNAIEAPLGYASREMPSDSSQTSITIGGRSIDVGEYCEGFWDRKVSTGQLSGDIRVLAATMYQRHEGVLSDIWVLAWPYRATAWPQISDQQAARGAPVIRISGTGTAQRTQYRLDALEETPALPDVASHVDAAADVFVWQSTVLSDSETSGLMKPNEAMVCVTRETHLLGMAHQPLLMPTVLNPDEESGRSHSAELVVYITSTKNPHDVTEVYFELLSDDLQQIDEERYEVIYFPQSLDPERRRPSAVRIDTAPHQGRTARLTVRYKDKGRDRDAEHYVYFPTTAELAALHECIPG